MQITLWSKYKKTSDPSYTKIVNGQYKMYFSHIYYLPTMEVPKTFRLHGKEFTLTRVEYDKRKNTAVLYITVTKNSFVLALVLGLVGLGIFTFFTLTKVERIIGLPGFIIPAAAGLFFMVKK